MIECHVAWMLGYLSSLCLLCFTDLIKIFVDKLSVPNNLYATAQVACFLLVPIASLLSSLVICLRHDLKSKFIANHSKEALNFQIYYTVYQFVAIGTILNLTWPSGINAGNYSAAMSDAFGRLAFLLLLTPVLIIIEICRFVWMFQAVRAILKSNFYYYPFSWRVWK